MKIAVAGGTGKTGRHVVEHVRDQGHHPVILVRAHGVDLIENTGIDASLDGVEAVIDVTDFATMNAKKAQASFGSATAAQFHEFAAQVLAQLPGAAGKAMATGALLPTQPGPRGKQTYAEWLAALTPERT